MLVRPHKQTWEVPGARCFDISAMHNAFARGDNASASDMTKASGRGMGANDACVNAPMQTVSAASSSASCNVTEYRTMTSARGVTGRTEDYVHLTFCKEVIGVGAI